MWSAECRLRPSHGIPARRVTIRSHRSRIARGMHPKPEVSARRVTHRSHHSQIFQRKTVHDQTTRHRVSQSSHDDTLRPGKPPIPLIRPPLCERILTNPHPQTPGQTKSSRPTPDFVKNHSHNGTHRHHFQRIRHPHPPPCEPILTQRPARFAHLARLRELARPDPTPPQPEPSPRHALLRPYCRRIISAYSSSTPRTRRSSQTRPRLPPDTSTSTPARSS